MFTGKFSQNSQENRLLSDLIIPLLFISFERLPLLVHGLCERVFETLPYAVGQGIYRKYIHHLRLAIFDKPITT